MLLVCSLHLDSSAINSANFHRGRLVVWLTTSPTTEAVRTSESWAKLVGQSVLLCKRFKVAGLGLLLLFFEINLLRCRDRSPQLCSRRSCLSYNLLVASVGIVFGASHWLKHACTYLRSSFYGWRRTVGFEGFLGLKFLKGRSVCEGSLIHITPWFSWVGGVELTLHLYL
jgi:hypothetical protein